MSVYVSAVVFASLAGIARNQSAQSRIGQTRQNEIRPRRHVPQRLAKVVDHEQENISFRFQIEAVKKYPDYRCITPDRTFYLVMNDADGSRDGSVVSDRSLGRDLLRNSAPVYSARYLARNGTPVPASAALLGYSDHGPNRLTSNGLPPRRLVPELGRLQYADTDS
jgi:hypothetical protein